MYKNILKWFVIGGLFLVPFIPFIVTKSLLFPFITGKGFAFRVLIEIIFGVWAFLALSEPEYRPKWNRITQSIVAFVVVVFFADLFSNYAYKSLWSNYERMEGFVTIAHLALYYFVLTGVFSGSGKDVWWKRFWNIQLSASVIMSIYGVLQLWGKVVINQGGVRLDATFGNASYLAIYMVYGLFIALLLLVREKNNILKWIYGITLVLQSVILYFTATRGAILGFIGGIIISALIIVWKEKGESQYGLTIKKISYWLLGGVIVLALIFVAIKNTDFVKNSAVLSRFSTLSVSEIQTQGRYYVWPMALKGVAERPILGWGQESFNFVFNKFYNPAMYGQEQWFDRTHNIVLDWLINAGILGLLSYILLYVALIYMVWKKSSFSLVEKSLVMGLVVAYVFHNMFVFDNLISYILFFTVLAWVSSMSTETPVPESTQMRFSNETLNFLWAPLIGLFVIGSVYYVNVPAISASQSLIGAMTNQSGPEINLGNFKKTFEYNSFGSAEALEQLVSVSTQVISNQSVSNDIKQKFFDLTKEQIVQKIADTPEDARYLLLGGSFFNRVGQYDVAIPYLTDAVKYSPNKQTMYFELGSSYLGKGDKTKAFELFEQGYNLEVDNPDAQIVYTIGALYGNKPDIVKAMFAKLGQDKIVADDRILQTYINIKDYNSALTILSLRLQKDPNNYNVELNVASLYAMMGDKAKAIMVLKDIETKNPSLKTQLDGYIKQLSQ